jgi:N-alpha-acetyltransferase 15/16, NatA auxiliary subunit
LPDS